MSFASRLLICLALLSATCFAQASPASRQALQQETNAGTTIKVNVKLVNVFATVTDQNGAPVAGLTKDHFRVFEDDAPQQIAVFERESGLPLSVVMAIDASLSTKKDLPLELESARRFARAILRPIDGMSIVQFSEIVDELQPFTSDQRRIERAISRVRVGASTALYDAIYLGSHALVPRQGRKVIVVITDGGDTASRTSYQEALRSAQTSEAIIYAVIMVPIEASAGRDTGGEHALIQMSKDTGGKHYYAKSIQQLDNAFRQISEELRTQYLIGYYPPKKAATDFRSIRLKVASPDNSGELNARYRTGYFTSKLE